MITTDQDARCAIWPKSPAKKWQESVLEDKTYYDSPRAGGRYVISGDAEEQLNYMDDSVETLRTKARLTTWLVEMRRQGEEWPFVTTEVIATVKRSQPLRIAERADRLLGSLVRVSPSMGTYYSLSELEALSAMAQSESTDINELVELVDFLSQHGLVSPPVRSGSNSFSFMLTAKGLARSEPPDHKPKNRIGFDLPHQT